MLCRILCLLLVFFFFFKQKTAYEMRISDWSSDVCSSDLSGGKAGDISISVGGGDLGKGGQLSLSAGRVFGAYYGGDLTMTSGFSTLTSSGEIGRASCRERVCQYV